MMGWDVVDALKTAAAAGNAKKPYVDILLCHTCHGLKLTCSYAGLNYQKIVGWTELQDAREPAALLLSVIDGIREGVINAVG